MQLCCTKKLLDEAGIAPISGGEDKDLFCWSAHLITVNRRKAIVAVNDSNRFGFILYGLKAKDFRGLDKLMLEGIISSLKDEKIKDEIIEQYVESAGDLVFARTRGPKYVARLNKACELVNAVEDLLDPGRLFQTAAGRVMNNDLVKIEKGSDFEHPYILLFMDLKQFSHQVISCTAADLIVKLDLGSSSAWRRIITPADINFKHLHKIIQAAFGWKEQHLYRFCILDTDGKAIENVISPMEEIYESRQGCKTLLETEAYLSDYIGRDCKIIYTYDYGDNWQHEVTVKKAIPDYGKNYPVCLMGEGNAPPEDVGGIDGYMNFLEIMKNPEHTEYENTLRWSQSQWYMEFDVKSVNRQLMGILR